MYRSHIKIRLLIILVGIFLSTLPIHAVESVQKLLQKDDRLMKVLMSDQNIYKNLATEMIENIWLIDLRPDGITIEWQFMDFNTDAWVKILRLHEGDTNPPLIIKQQVEYNDKDHVYRYIDTTAKDTSGFYKYLLIMDDPVKPSTSYLSKLIFTVRQPKIANWGDFIKSVYTRYINGKKDSLTIEPNSLMFENPEWHAQLIRYKSTVKEQKYESEWEEVKTKILNLKYPEITNGENCNYFIQSKDYSGNTSRWSEPKIAVFDCFAPGDVEYLNVLSRWDEIENATVCELSWGNAIDNLSGLKSYFIYRKINNVDFDSLDLILPDTQHNHIDIIKKSKEDSCGTPIYYKIGSCDNVDNNRLENQISIVDTGVCLCSPRIKIIADTTDEIAEKKYIKTESVKIIIDKCNFTFLVGFNVKTDDSDLFVYQANDTINMPLSTDHEYPIKLRALFKINDDTVASDWSNCESVVREFDPPSCVLNLKACNNPDSSKGTIYLNWEQPSNDATSYIVERKDNERNFNEIGKTNELHFEDFPPIVFESYTYKIRGCNLFDKPHSESCPNCIKSTAICNHAPKIDSIWASNNNQGENVCIDWSFPQNLSKYPIEEVRFEIDRYDYSFPKEKADEHYFQDSDTSFCTNLKRDRDYYFVVRATCNGELFSAWSEPKCIKSSLLIPPVKQLELQNQPSMTEPRIFICWNNYRNSGEWKQKNIDINSVTQFRIFRYRLLNNNWNVDLELCEILKKPYYEFLKGSKEWENEYFIDLLKLHSGMKYRYEVIPFQQTYAGLQSPNGNVGNEIVAEIGRVYIPKIDTTKFSFSPQKKASFFDDKDNKLTVNWYWPKNNLKGASSILVEISDNSNFDDSGTHFKLSKSINNTDPDCKNQSTTFNNLNLPPTCIDANDKIFIRITAYDKWKNKNPYYSTDWDKNPIVISDKLPPEFASLKMDSVRADTSADSDKVLVKLALDYIPTDLESGLKSYHLIRKDISSQPIDTVTIKSIQTTDTTFIVDLSDIQEATNFYFDVTTEDWVGHQQPNNEHLIWKPLYAPKNFDVWYFENDRNTIYYSYDRVANAIGYYIEWADTILCLGKDFLRNLPNTHKKVYTDSGTININQPLNKHCFHVLAFQQLEKNESGWSIAKKPRKEVKQIEINKETFNSFINNLEVPDNYFLSPVYPNPFNSKAILNFGLPHATDVTLVVYNYLGNEVITIIDDFREPGYYLVEWNGKNSKNQLTSSGVYFVVLKTNNFYKTIKCLFVK